MRTFQILVFSLFVFLFSVQSADAQVRTNSRLGTIKAKESNKRLVLTSNGLTAAEFQLHFDKYTKLGYNLVFIDGYLHREGMNNNASTKTRFNAIFELDDTPFAAFFGLTGAKYQEKFNEYTKAGFRLSFIESYRQNGQIRYAPIFTKESGPAWKAMHGLTQAAYQQKFNTLTGQGYRLVNRSVVVKGGKKYVAALFDKANVGSWIAKSNLKLASTQTMMETQNKAGRKVAFMDITQTTTSDITFSPIFDKAPHNAWYALNNLTLKQLNAEIAKAHSKGYKTIMVRGFDVQRLARGFKAYEARYAAAWVK